MVDTVNDLEIQKLKKKRADLPSEIILALDQALTTFAGSPRFPMISGVKLGVFLEGDLSEIPVAESSLEELIQGGTYQLCQDERLSQEVLEKLTALLGKLVEEPDLVAETPTEFDVTEYVPPAMDSPESDYVEPKSLTTDAELANTFVQFVTSQRKQKLSSVEEENKLQEAFSRLKANASFQRIYSLKIADYWNKEIGNAPFIESMTFGQLVEIKVAHLLEKRSHTERKTQGILEAIESVLSQFPDQKLAEGNQQPSTTVSPRVSVKVLEWRKSRQHIPAIAEIVSGYYDSQVGAVASGRSELARLMDEVPKVLNRSQFSLLWLDLEYEPEVVSQIFKQSETDLAGIRSRALELMSTSLSEIESSLIKHWQTALAGPGITEERLFSSDFDQQIDRNFQISFCRFLLGCLGASHPTAFSNTYESYWTTNLSVLQIILSGLLSSLPRTDHDFRRELSVLLPFFDADQLLSSLEGMIYFDEDKGVWLVVS